MCRDELFESATRSSGDLAGVFEYDGDSGFFYLYGPMRHHDNKVIAAIHVVDGVVDFGREDVTIVWDPGEKTVGLFIRGQLVAAFDGSTGAKYGGDYDGITRPVIPKAIADAFAPKQ